MPQTSDSPQGSEDESLEPRPLFIDVVPSKDSIHVADAAERLHRLVTALGIEAERSGSHVSYGDMSEAEGQLVMDAITLMDRRFPHLHD